MNYDEAKKVIELTLKTKNEITDVEINNVVLNIEEATKVAIEALEKQIAKNPIKRRNDEPYYEDGHYDHFAPKYKFHCPVCARWLDMYQHHCKCGQALDWKKEDVPY